jgi:hypothetical protein
MSVTFDYFQSTHIDTLPPREHLTQFAAIDIIAVAQDITQFRALDIRPSLMTEHFRRDGVSYSTVG